MKSLRAQLLVATTLGATAVLLGCGALLDALLGRVLRADFDAALAAKARSLSTLAEQNEDGLEFEITESALPEFAASPMAEYYEVWRADGSVLARSPSLQGNHLDRLSSADSGTAFASARLPDGRPGRLVAMTFIPRQEYEVGAVQPPMALTLVVGRATEGLETTLARVRAILVGVGVTAVALCGAALAWTVRRSLKPVNLLSRRIADVGADDLSTRLAPSSIPTELLPVVDRLNDLLARLEAAFQRERRFTGDVAHELRTPLAGLRARIELALSRDRSTEVYQRALGDCLSISLTLQRMVDDLLHLARADAGQLDVRRERVDLPCLIEECWQTLEDKARARHISARWHLQADRHIETDRARLGLVLRNVLGNAVSHADDAARIDISTSVSNGFLELKVGNPARTLAARDVACVFDRFWRGDSARSPSEDHYGLGLPICKAVVERLGGAIEAALSGDGVFTITIRLPKDG